MASESAFVLTQGHFLSNLTDMRDGTAKSFTTPSVTLGAGDLGADRLLVLDLFIPAYTNRSPGNGVGAYSRPTMDVVLQHAAGNPATEANWRDLLWLKQIQPHVPSGSTGVGTVANPVLSNRYRAAFQTDRTNVRLSGNFLGSWADFSQLYAAIKAGMRRGHEMD